MCISNGAILRNTKGYIGRTKNNTVIMAYQMEAQAIGNGLRAIILQIPAQEIVKIHDTTNYCNFLNEIEEQSSDFIFDPLQGCVSRELTRASKSLSVNKPVLEKVGMYDVVTLESYKQFEFLKEVFPEGKCPEVSTDLIDFYGEYYSDWKFLVATFDNKIPMSSQPFMVEYKSQIGTPEAVNDEICEVYIFPALDNGDKKGLHQGVPIMQQIAENHLLSFPHEKGLNIKFSQPVPTDLISNRVAFYQMSRESANGDFIVFANGNKPKKMDFKTLGTQSVNKLNKNESGCTNTCAFTNW